MEVSVMSTSEIAHIIEVVILILLSVGSFVVQKFLQYLFNEIKTSRLNERELYVKMADTREMVLQTEVKALEREIARMTEEQQK
jgi:hypothetical protein